MLQNNTVVVAAATIFGELNEDMTQEKIKKRMIRSAKVAIKLNHLIQGAYAGISIDEAIDK
jgi:hypothetical protein